MSIQHNQTELTFEAFVEMAKEKKVYGATLFNNETGQRRYYGLDSLEEKLGDEVWDLWLYSELTGHMYRGSPHETSNSCGNCDGARCDGCKLVWVAELCKL